MEAKSKVSVNAGGSYLAVIPKCVRTRLGNIGQFDVFELSIRPLPIKIPRALRVRKINKEAGGNRVVVNELSRLTIPKALAYDLGLEAEDELVWEWIDGELWAHKKED